MPAAERRDSPPTGAERRRYLRLTQEVFVRCQAHIDGGDEQVFVYPDRQGWRRRLAEVEEYWRRQLPWFGMRVDEGPAGTLHLVSAGDARTAHYLRALAHRSGQHHDLDRVLRSQLTVSGRAASRLQRGWRRCTQGLRQLPQFLVIGAAKAGTGFLYHALTQHPEVIGGWSKEAYFFDHGFARGLGAYRAHFPLRTRGRRLTGEATPCYLFHPHAPRRVAATLAEVRVIVLLRNPVDRAYSDYSQARRMGREPLSFEAALDAEPARTEGELERMLADEAYFAANRWHHSYCGRGRYAEQLERWFAHLPRAHFLVLRSEDLFTAPRRAAARVAAFLQIAPWQFAETRRNSVPYPPMPAGVRTRLVEHFRPHNERLARLLGEPVDWDR